MSILANQPATGTFTPEDLLRLKDRNRYELVDGRLVERNVSVDSSEAGHRIGLLLGNEARRVGGIRVFGADMGYQCFPDAPNKIRKPDVSLVRAGRMAGVTGVTGFIPIPPDLAVEVLSPNDSAREVNEKIDEYLAARFPLVWVADPQARAVAIYRVGGSVIRLHENDEITGESALPSFRCRVGEFFPSVAAP